MNPSSFASSLITTVGANGTDVSMSTLSDELVPVLPAWSVITPETVSDELSPGLGEVTFTLPFAISVADNTTSCICPKLSETVNVSPASASPGKPTCILISPFASVALMKPSLFVSSVIVTVGAEGTAVSTSAVSVPI